MYLMCILYRFSCKSLCFCSWSSPFWARLSRLFGLDYSDYNVLQSIDVGNCWDHNFPNRICLMQHHGTTE